jgi:hypothetical protein
MSATGKAAIPAAAKIVGLPRPTVRLHERIRSDSFL